MNIKDRRKELYKVLGLSSEQEIALYDYAELLQKQPQKVTNLQARRRASTYFKHRR